MILKRVKIRTKPVSVAPINPGNNGGPLHWFLLSWSVWFLDDLEGTSPVFTPCLDHDILHIPMYLVLILSHTFFYFRKIQMFSSESCFITYNMKWFDITKIRSLSIVPTFILLSILMEHLWRLLSIVPIFLW